MPRIGLRTAEALVEGAEAYLTAEPEIVIGELDGPVGTALAFWNTMGPANSLPSVPDRALTST